MQNSRKRFSVIIGFGLLVIVLVANAIITRRQLRVQTDSQIWVAHSREVLLEVSQTESLLKDAETGQRGFLYTGDQKYLAPYNRASEQVQPTIEKLARLTSDNPGQQVHIAELRKLSRAKLQESLHPGQVEMPALVESVLTIYSNKFKTKSITILREFGDCPPIHGMAGELKQVVSNLISNAADAVSENGTIRVKLECVDGTGGQRVLVRIEDDGPGIGAEHRDRIFEPFFTTKQDVGTGLGLWVTKEIIDRHGGEIEVRSRKEERASGAVFDVLLPCVQPGQGATGQKQL